MRYGVAVCVFALACGPSLAQVVEVTPYVARGTPSEQGVDWVGWAVAPTGRTFKGDSSASEDDARARAKRGCEQAVGRTCSAIAVPSDWGVASVNCTPSASFIGGSSLGNAVDVAREKADRAGFYGAGCAQVYATQ